MMLPRALALALGGALLALTGVARAEPTAAAPFPAFTVRDLTNATHSERELPGRRTLVVVITGPAGGDEMARWLTAARARYPAGNVRVLALVALALPFYAFDDVVRGQARGRTAPDRWRETWLDRDGTLQRALGLPNDNAVPWTYALNEAGVVCRGLHAPLSSPAAQQIWDDLQPVASPPAASPPAASPPAASPPAASPAPPGPSHPTPAPVPHPDRAPASP